MRPNVPSQSHRCLLQGQHRSSGPKRARARRAGPDGGRSAQRRRLEARRRVHRVESASRKANKAKPRPQLEAALAHCRVMRARLIVANVSRLTRDPEFMSKLVEAGVEVEFCDLPRIDGPIGTFMLRQMLSVAELEAGMISERTKKALAAAKARGQQLGGNRGNIGQIAHLGREASLKVRQERARQRAADLEPIIADLRGVRSLREVAAALNELGVPAPRGGLWK